MMAPSAAVTVLLPTRRCRLSLSVNAVAALALWPAPFGQPDQIIAVSAAPRGWSGPVTCVEVDATTRLDWPQGARSVAVIGLQSLSSLSGLYLWDLAHKAGQGSQITLVDLPTALRNCPFERRYYAGWLVEEQTTDARCRTFRKTAPAPAEADVGLERWSFGLPMGRPDPLVLGGIAERILGLGLSDVEILVACGAEHAGQLPAPVRHVPVEAGASLTAKKNALVEAAKAPNVCVFHDRLLPPRNFKTAVEAFGDLFPVTGFQNLVVEPDSHTIRRYSDYHMEVGPGASQVAAVGPGGEETAELYGLHLDLRQKWRADFVEASVHEYNDNCYLTGSFYMTKRSVWSMCGQDDRIDWGCLEDVEFGHRAAQAYGIPMRVNPFGFARTERVRPSAEPMQRVADDRLGIADAAPAHARMIAGDQTPSVFPIDESGYRDRLLRFIERWAPSQNWPEARRLVATTQVNDVADLGALLANLIHLSTVRRWAPELKAFAADLASELMASPLDPAAETALVGSVMQGASLAKELLRSSAVSQGLLAGLKKPLFRTTEIAGEDLLTARLLEVWADERYGVSFPGSFKEFMAAVEATL